MRRTFLSRTHQGDLFSPPAKLPELPAEVRQKMTRLLAKMLNEYLRHRRSSVAKKELSDE
jgi:hypothetical protein